MKIQHHRINANVVVGLLVREFRCSGTDVSAKVLAMYAGTRTPSMEPQWLAAGLSQYFYGSMGESKESYTSIDWTWNRDYLSALFWKKQFYFAGIDYCIWHFTFMAEKREKRGAL